MVSGGNHNGSCAHATGHHCACSGCGGSLHGWDGWLTLVTAEPARETRAEAFEEEARRREGKRKPAELTPLTRMSLKALVTDLTRLDLARWLSKQRRGMTAGAPLAPSNGPTGPGGSQEASPDDSQDAPPGSDRTVTTTPQTEDGGDAGIKSGAGSKPDATQQIEVLAQCMAKATWSDIAAEIAASTPNAATVRSQLANHFWCDLFVGFARAVENFQQGVQEIPDSAKELIKQSVRGSSKQSARSAVSDRIINFAVDRAWTAFRTATFGASPLLALLTGDELLRSLRILAVFICPAPERHTEVRIHALKPLAGDARQYLAEETKTRLAGSFADLGKPAVPTT